MEGLGCGVAFGFQVLLVGLGEVVVGLASHGLGCKIAFENTKQESEVSQLKLENYLKVKNQGSPTEIEDRPEYSNMNSDIE
ncbi:hypothetical protein T459_25913 [Capsicum annuum]|uniref:Uncharacterized protein n=1 Tax=Capsicum annuum TaxID=4072 RepID=A0A2G2YM24_CAPAN|nr:hypothetical protein T459_25913 [Capsicum annuum]